ncbi:von Willebrand factor A domain containing 5A, gene 2 L homeolog [Xenopus laevis]|uniref:MGC83495 protein n=1 Tax=Xenopus laevis TaxID=8355 RepID=Q6IND5_XENLA|nr:von Willebrand factor A domain containing 5A, gene 2 L homeolog [Xenopus laevis]AAH72348.1 MGC83495 protein [Xenopus laevis]
MDSCCGLIISCSRVPVPLRGISVEMQVKGFVADVCATLKYKNTEEKPIEAVFVFPLDQDSAVYSFEATVEGKKIVADIQERQQANKTYDEAISQGQEAFLLQEDESSGDVFSCSVGNLPPGQEAEVKLSFVRELPVESDGAVRFVLPTVLNPRYTPKEHEESVTATVPRLPADKIPYSLDLTAHFQSVYGISKIESNCELSPIQYTDGDKLSAKVSLAQGHKFDRDVELLAYYLQANTPSAMVEAGLPNAVEGSIMADPVVMLNFYPNFPETKEKSNFGEFIFLMDRSGSMTEQMTNEQNAPRRIDSAKETLILLLKSLPLGCYFNIFSFGSDFTSIFSESMAYTQQSMEEAVKLVNQMDADMGGTEILEPLKKIYKTAGRPSHPRQLFVFTDGEVGNTNFVIDEVRRNAHNHRCFTFGIGEGASTALIKGLARAASGTFEFITGKERMQPKVLQTLKCSLQPTVKDITLTWTLPPGVEAVLLSGTPTAIFQGQRSIVYAQLKGKVEQGAEGQVSLAYNFKDEIFNNVLRFTFNLAESERPTMHRLAAKVVISNLIGGENPEEKSEEVKKQIVETSIQSGVISSLTAYVAVNKETKNPVKGPPVQRNVPLFGAPIALRCSMPMPMPTPRMMSGQPMAMACYMATEDMCYDSPQILAPEFAPVEGEYNPQIICHFPAPTPVPAMPPLPTPELADPTSGPVEGEAQPEVAVCYWPGPSAEESKPEIAVCYWPEPTEVTDATSGPVEELSPTAKAERGFFKLISLQNADGSWNLDAEFASAFDMSEEGLKEKIPDPNVDSSLWATVVAVLWLHASRPEQRDEWELLEDKALDWIKAKAASSLSECVRAGNLLLNSSVDIKVFGL